MRRGRGTGWRLAAASSVLGLLLPVTACGENRIQSYCDDLGAHRKQIASMLDSTSSDALLGRLGLMKQLAADAPSDLQDEWQLFLGAVEGLRDALKKAHVGPSDFVGGKPPAGLSAADRQAIVDAADQLGSDDVVAAASGIEQQARDVCKINLGL